MCLGAPGVALPRVAPASFEIRAARFAAWARARFYQAAPEPAIVSGSCRVSLGWPQNEPGQSPRPRLGPREANSARQPPGEPMLAPEGPSQPPPMCLGTPDAALPRAAPASFEDRAARPAAWAQAQGCQAAPGPARSRSRARDSDWGPERPIALALFQVVAHGPLYVCLYGLCVAQLSRRSATQLTAPSVLVVRYCWQGVRVLYLGCPRSDSCNIGIHKGWGGHCPIRWDQRPTPYSPMLAKWSSASFVGIRAVGLRINAL